MSEPFVLVPRAALERAAGAICGDCCDGDDHSEDCRALAELIASQPVPVAGFDETAFREVARGLIGKSSLSAWCEAYGALRANTADYLAHRRYGPPTSLLNALGFRWAIVPNKAKGI